MQLIRDRETGRQHSLLTICSVFAHYSLFTVRYSLTICSMSSHYSVFTIHSIVTTHSSATVFTTCIPSALNICSSFSIQYSAFTVQYVLLTICWPFAIQPLYLHDHSHHSLTICSSTIQYSFNYSSAQGCSPFTHCPSPFAIHYWARLSIWLTIHSLFTHYSPIIHAGLGALLSLKWNPQRCSLFTHYSPTIHPLFTHCTCSVALCTI